MASFADALLQVPGKWSAAEAGCWGSERLRRVLQSCRCGGGGSDVIMQCSSIGSLSEEWLSYFTSVLSTCSDDIPPPMPSAKFIWPTVEDVRTSLAGYSSGSSLPSPAKNFTPHLRKLMFKWKGHHDTGSRSTAANHDMITRCVHRAIPRHAPHQNIRARLQRRAYAVACADFEQSQ